MKTLLKILVPLFLAFTVQAQWQEVLDLPADYCSGIEFKNDSVGIIVTGAKFLYTQDGGTTWDIIRAPTGILHYDWLDDSTLYFTNQGRLFKTFDLGNTWVFITPNEQLGLIEFTSKNIGYSYASDDILKTTDGGITWSVYNLYSTSTGNYTDLVFVNADVGFASGWYTRGVDRTTDAGETWQYNDDNQTWDLFFLNENEGFSCGFYGVVKRTVNGGETWESINVPNSTQVLRSIWCKDKLTCLTAGSLGYIGVTNDGGQTWVEESAGTTDDFRYTGCSSKYCFLSTGAKLYRRENTLGIAENNAQEVLFNLQPNPLKESFSLQLAEPMPIQTVEVYSTAGSLVKQFSGAQDVYVVKDLPAGTYLLEVTTTSGRGVKQFIKE